MTHNEIMAMTDDELKSQFKALGNTINQAVLRCYLASKQGGNNG